MQRGLQPGQVPILGKLIFAEGFEQRFDARLVKPVGQKSRQRLRRGRAQVYDRAMLKLTREQRAAAEAGGKRPYWRFLLSGMSGLPPG